MFIKNVINWAISAQIFNSSTVLKHEYFQRNHWYFRKTLAEHQRTYSFCKSTNWITFSTSKNDFFVSPIKLHPRICQSPNSIFSWKNCKVPKISTFSTFSSLRADRIKINFRSQRNVTLKLPPKSSRFSSNFCDSELPPSKHKTKRWHREMEFS